MVFVFLVKGAEKVNAFSLVFKFVICVVWPFINPNNDVDVEFKFVICVVWPFINPNNDDDVEFKFVIWVVWPFINPNRLVDVVFKFVICVVLNLTMMMMLNLNYLLIHLNY